MWQSHSMPLMEQFGQLEGLIFSGSSRSNGFGEIGVPQIPKLATGGVAYGPMVAQIGEYAGARNNPEIVTPENLMRQIIREETGSQKRGSNRKSYDH